MMGNVLAAAWFAVEVMLPSVLMLALGWVLKRTGQIDAHFAGQAVKLVFHYGLPLLLFANLVGADIHYAEQAVLLSAGLVCTLILFVGAEIYAWRFVPELSDKGVFVQGVYRSNMAIMGLAFVQNAYGNDGLAAGAVYMGLLTIFYNILAVITLSRGAEGGWGHKFVSVLKNIVKNPLIVAIVLALVLQRLHVAVPDVLVQTARYVGNISLPLALICAGAAFDFRSMFQASGIAVQASVGRLVVAPLVAIVCGVMFGLSGIPMGVLFLMVATPVAAASYVMAKAMGGNDVAAANIMGITTFGAIFSAVGGMVVLRSLDLM